MATGVEIGCRDNQLAGGKVGLTWGSDEPRCTGSLAESAVE